MVKKNTKKISGGIKYKNPKGFTLVELLAVIVILAVIALIVTPIITGVIENARKGAAVSSAYGYIESIENETALAYLNGNLYEDKDDYAYDEIEVDAKGDKPTAGIYSLEKSKVTTAVFCISGYVVSYDDNEVEVGEKCNPEDLKYNSSLKLSSTFGSYTYPETKAVEIIENISGGNLSCISSDEEVATCSIEGNTMTVTSGTKEGTSTITVISGATKKHKEAKAVYVATSENGLLSVTASDKTVTYDGNLYGIEVTSSGATIKYMAEDGNYTLDESPVYKDAETYTIYYQVTKEGYKTITSSKTLTIKKAENPIDIEGKTNLTYDGTSQILATVSYAQGNVCYSTTNEPTSCESTESIPTGINAGNYTVYYYVSGTKNYKEKSGSVTVTIVKTNDTLSLIEKTTTYDGTSQTATFTSVSGLTPNVTYYSNETCTAKVTGSLVNAGIYYATATTSGNNNYNEGNLECTKAVTISKANNTLELSANTGTVTYPTSKTVEVTKNTSGGTLSCTSSNEEAVTCSLNGNTVTVTPGTKEAENITLTIKSAETTNYNEGQVSYTVTSENGLLSVTASDKTVTYDGNAYGIEVTSSGATIKYKAENGSYTLDESPKYANAGTYTIYYQVTKAGYKTVTESKTLTINKAEGNATLSETEGIVYVGETKTFTVSDATGELSCISDNEDVATCLVEDTTVTINGIAEGSAIITIDVAESSNYNKTSKTYSLISERLTSPYTGTLTSNGWTATYVDGQMTTCKYGNYNACTNSSCSSAGLDGCTGDTNTNYYYSYRDTIPIMGTCTSYRYCFMGSPYGTYCDYRYFNYVGECNRHIQYNCNSGAWCSGCETYTSSCQTGTNYSAYYTAKGANLPSYYEE